MSVVCISKYVVTLKFEVVPKIVVYQYNIFKRLSYNRVLLEEGSLQI